MTDHPRLQLQHIILHYGRSICDDPKRCEALLRDLCPDNRREVNLLVMALKEDVAKDLLTIGQASVSMEVLMLRLSQRLQDQFGTAEQLAIWSVETWAMALGIPVIPLKNPAVPSSVSLAPAKSSTLLAAEKQFAGWQKFGESGELLAADASQWAAVRDERSGLMWAINTNPRVNFPNSVRTVTALEAYIFESKANSMHWCGYDGWRVPTVDELKSLLTAEKHNGMHIRRDVFPDIVSDSYGVWSSSSFVTGGGRVWFVNFVGGYANGYSRDGRFYVRLVRSSTR